MSRKPKFNPEITRVKLNPEQAVLLCTCYTGHVEGTTRPTSVVCVPGTKNTTHAEYQIGAEGIS